MLISYSLQFYHSSDPNPCWFSKPNVLGAYVSMLAPRIRVSDVGHNLFTPQGRVPCLRETLLVVGCHACGGVLGKDLSLPLLPSQCVLFVFCCGGADHLILRVCGGVNFFPYINPSSVQSQNHRDRQVTKKAN